MNENQNFTQFENQPMGNGFYGDSGVDNVTKKGKGKKAAVAGGLAALVVVGGGGAAYACSDLVKNQVKLRTMKPENYYAWVYENNSESISKTLSESYSKYLDQLEKGSSANLKLKYDVPDSVKDLLKEEFNTGVEEEDAEFEKIINNINSVSLDADTSVKSNLMNANINLNLNDDTLVSTEAYENYESLFTMLRIPELNDRWLGIDLSSAGNEMTSLYTKLLTNPASVLTAEQLESEISKYVGVWCEFSKDVTLEKSEDVDIADITVKYTVAQVNIDEKFANELGVKMLEELKNDTVIKNIAVNSLKLVSEEEYEEDIQEEIDILNEALESGDLDEETIAFKTYIDATGEIRGFGIEAEDESGQLIIGKDDSKIRGKFEIVSDGEVETSAVLTADEESKDTYSGSLVLSDQEEELFSLDFNSLKVVDEEMGYSEGSMTFNVDEVSPITVNLSSDGKSQTIAYSINVEGEDYGTVELIYSVEKSASVEMPADNNIVTITAEDMYDFDIKEYASEEEVEAFIKNILTKIGINDESVDEMAKLAVDSIFAEGNAFEPTIFDDEEFNFDDEDFEFDDEDFEFNDEDFNFDDIDLEDYEMTEDELNDILAEIEALEPTTTAKAS